MEKKRKNCTKYEDTNFGGILKYGKPIITIKSHKDQCQVNMNKHGIWDILYIPDL